MGELIAHLFGDYVFQAHYLALNKTKSSAACLIHVVLYTLPFLFLTRSPLALSIIVSTHFIIDRWSIAKQWPEFYGIGCEGRVGRKLREWACEWAILSESTFRCNTWSPPPSEACVKSIRSEFVPLEPAPPFLAVWLTIIVDNTVHLAINHLALMV